MLDIGCGTGTLACLLAQRGLRVTAVDPAAASLDVARSKAYANRVLWILGNTAMLPPLQVDLVTMTGKVAQLFLDDDDCASNLEAARAALQPEGQLVFEARDRARQARREWNREQSFRCLQRPGGSSVETGAELSDVAFPTSPSGGRSPSPTKTRCSHPTPRCAFAASLRSKRPCARPVSSRSPCGTLPIALVASWCSSPRRRAFTKAPGPAARPEPFADPTLSRAHLTAVVRASVNGPARPRGHHCADDILRSHVPSLTL